jgi:CNT family concentrative nucleoside transporter
MHYNLISLTGTVLLMVIAWLLSQNKKVINWRLIFWGIGFQVIFAFFIFKIPAGTKIFLVLNDIVIKILDSAAEGARFVFGRLALPPGTHNEAGETSLGFILAFQAFPTIIFFSALTASLYFIRFIPWIIKWFAYIFTRLMRISGVESLCAVSNIFFGIESVFTIKPHLKALTRSELATILTVGMSTVASNVLALYVFSLKEQFPNIAGHLISASFLSAPAAIIMSKLMLPETDTPKTLGLKLSPYYEREENLFMAIINGANAGLRFIAGIVALLIAVVSLVYLFDMFIGWLGRIAGIPAELSLKTIMGYIFYPLTFILGIPVSEVGAASQIIGEKIVLTEVVAYNDLAQAIQNGVISSPRTIIITSYALCGFTHLASMAIFVGGISVLIPERTKLLTKLSFRCLIAATLACLMTAAIAGIFSSESNLLFR